MAACAVVDVIVADPPWKFRDQNMGRGASAHYPCLSVEQLERFRLPPLGADAVLFLWRCGAMQAEALRVISAWGFVLKTELVWLKFTKNGRQHFGQGHYVRSSHEVCLIAARGRARPAYRSVRSSFGARVPVNARGRAIHSAKPEEFFAIVERLYPNARRVEMFARRRRAGWEQYGNQVGIR